MNILFVCSQGRHRSRTAAEYVGRQFPAVTTRFAGVLSDADVTVSEADTVWADLIVCMEQYHRNRLRKRFKGLSRKTQVWGIEDLYNYEEPALLALVKDRIGCVLE